MDTQTSNDFFEHHFDAILHGDDQKLADLYLAIGEIDLAINLYLKIEDHSKVVRVLLEHGMVGKARNAYALLSMEDEGLLEEIILKEVELETKIEGWKTEYNHAQDQELKEALGRSIIYHLHRLGDQASQKQALSILQDDIDLTEVLEACRLEDERIPF